MKHDRWGMFGDYGFGVDIGSELDETITSVEVDGEEYTA